MEPDNVDTIQHLDRLHKRLAKLKRIQDINGNKNLAMDVINEVFTDHTNMKLRIDRLLDDHTIGLDLYQTDFETQFCAWCYKVVLFMYSIYCIGKYFIIV